MTNDERDDTNDSQALTGGTHQLLVTKSTRSQVRGNANMLWQTRQYPTWNGSRGLGGTSWGSHVLSACYIGNRVASRKRIQTPIGEATEPLDDRCQLD